MTPCNAPSIARIGALLRSGEIGVRELTQQCLERERETRALNAYTDLFAEEALAVADAHQALLCNGVDLGPLHGIPVALKANIAVAGRAAHAGSLILREQVCETDAAVTRRLKRAGAVLLGYTNMHEFAWGGTTDNPHFGACRNAIDPARIPAGSSGGSGTAVAAGSAMAALGTDTGGSVRLPASMNGVSGLRPGLGRIPTDGVFPLAWSMDTVGPIARTPADCAALFGVLAGARPAPSAPIGRRRIGILRDYSLIRLQPGIEHAMLQTIARFEACGASVVEIDIADLAVAVDAQVIVDACEPSAVHESWIGERPADYGADVRALLQAGLAFTAVEYIQAQRYRTTLRHRFDAALGEVDAILTPTLPFTAPRIGEDRVLVGDREESTLTGNMRFTCLPSLTGLPALSFPVGTDRDGLPIGAQLMGRAGEEQALCDIAEALGQPDPLATPDRQASDVTPVFHPTEARVLS